ncbi:MAG: sensor histidine kinase, partial [Bacteroidia bacterium]
LFPGDVLPKKDFLLLHLENKEAYIFERIKGMLFLTLFITLLILSVFYVTIRTILKQKKLAEIKNDFINNMSHEFKTPIATISIAVDAINNQKIREKSERLDYYSAIIKEENNKMNEHVEKVLTLALADKQQLSMNRDEVDMHVLIRNCLNSYELLIREKQAEVRLSLSATFYKLRGDKFHLYGAVKNIIDNAVKYSSAMPVIGIRTYNEGDYFCFAVKDNGHGMSKETQKNIFDKFYRAQTGNIHDVKGFGLGLNYVKNIVDAHKGWIHVESQQGRGSEFVIKLKRE